MAPETENFPCFVLDPSGGTWVELSNIRETFRKHPYWVCKNKGCAVRNFRKVRNSSSPMPVQLEDKRVIYCEGGGKSTIDSNKTSPF